MSELVYKVGELKQLIKESSTEFNAKMGTSVEKDNKSNSEKSYKEAEKRAKDFDGGLREPKKNKPTDREDYNGSTLDYDTVRETDPETRKRFEVQAAGYTSELEKNNGIEKDPSLEYNDDFYKDRKKTKAEKDKREKVVKYSGISSQHYDISKDTVRPCVRVFWGRGDVSAALSTRSRRRRSELRSHHSSNACEGSARR